MWEPINCWYLQIRPSLWQCLTHTFSRSISLIYMEKVCNFFFWDHIFKKFRLKFKYLHIPFVAERPRRPQKKKATKSRKFLLYYFPHPTFIWHLALSYLFLKSTEGRRILKRYFSTNFSSCERLILWAKSTHPPTNNKHIVSSMGLRGKFFGTKKLSNWWCKNIFTEIRSENRKTPTNSVTYFFWGGEFFLAL